MQTLHLGLNLGQDQSAAVVADGEILVAIQQERLDRVKYSVGVPLQSPDDPSSIRLPDAAIRYCLDACGAGLDDLATITANMPGHDHGPRILARALPAGLRGRIRSLPGHHLAHAHCAWWPSGFQEGLVLVADGSGSTGPDRRTESYSLYRADGVTLTRLHAESVEAHLAELSTLGFLYEHITRRAGFVSHPGSALSVPEAGKLMGLAPYGGPQVNWQRWIRPRADGYGLEISAYDVFLEVEAIAKRYDDGRDAPYMRPWLVDLAYKVQKELEDALLHLVERAMRETGQRRLCLAGGVALNSVANYALLTRLGLDDVFVFPAAGDAGIAAGCALWAYASEGGRRRVPLARATLGRAYADAEIAAALERFAGRIRCEAVAPREAVGRAAAALAEGRILARFEGGSEFGPRALGHRSILADPTFAGMRDVLNARVKRRERFRPFAPVIPEEDLGRVFRQAVPSPFMLLVAPIRPEVRPRIPAVTHCDGSGRVQTVTAAGEPFLHDLCQRLAEVRGDPPVLLNTSFNVAGQPIVETPEEAIETFLGTDIDILSLEGWWITKPQAVAADWAETLARIAATSEPRGLPQESPGVLDLMAELDRALFGEAGPGCPWTPQELARLSALGGRFKETSRLFPGGRLGAGLRTRLSPEVVLLLDPLGQSELIRHGERPGFARYGIDDLELLLAAHRGDREHLEALRTARGRTTREWRQDLDRAAAELAAFGLPCGVPPTPAAVDDAPPEATAATLAPFADADFSLRRGLAEVREALIAADYRAAAIGALLGVASLALIPPTHLGYFDRFRLPADPQGDLIRLFLARGALSRGRLTELFGESGSELLIRLGILIPRGEGFASRVDLYEVDGLFLATDHRYLLLAEDCQDEDPVMYIGLDSLGLVHTAPRRPAADLLDLCTGCGVQALVASRYARRVTGVDLNPRAVRFARFNAQLNGIDNAEFRIADLYQGVAGRRFDAILANPPFVPSPGLGPAFRDGGPRGDAVLAGVVSGAADHLSAGGRLYLVSDLADPEGLEATLARWWRGGPAHVLVLQTADRDEVMFSVAHSHHPFGQSFEDYNAELARWVDNFRAAGLRAVNFGYVLVERLEAGAGSFLRRVIQNPDVPIHEQVRGHFEQQCLLGDPGDGDAHWVGVAPDLSIHRETDAGGRLRSIRITAEGNPYFSTYRIGPPVLRLIEELAASPVRLGALAERHERPLILSLIGKGILRLSAARPGGTPSGQEAAAAAREEAAPEQHGLAPGALRFEELESKTTPTCLTSYLRRQ